MPTTDIESWTSLLIQGGALALLAVLMYKAPVWLQDLMNSIAKNNDTLIKTMAAERIEYLKEARAERDAVQHMYREELQRDREAFLSRNAILEATLKQESADVKRGQVEIKQGQADLKQGQTEMKSHLIDIKEDVRRIGNHLEQSTDPDPPCT